MAPHGPRRVVKYVVWTRPTASRPFAQACIAPLCRTSLDAARSREARPTRRAGVRRVFGAARNSHFASVDAGERVEALLATVRAIRGRAGSRRQNAVDGSR